MLRIRSTEFTRLLAQLKGSHPTDQGFVELALAQALLRAHGVLPRIRGYAKAARDDCQSVGPGAAKEQSAAQAVLTAAGDSRR